MKKIILAIFVSLPLLSISQSLKVTDMIVHDEGDLLKATCTVTNTSANPITVKVKRNVESLAEGHINYFCWGACYGPNTDMSLDQDALTIEPGASNTSSFFGDIQTSGSPGVSKVSYCFFDRFNPLDETCVSYTYDKTTGIQVITISEDDVLTSVYPNPVQSIGKLGYDLSGKKYTEANVIVRNLTGAVVKNIKLTQTAGEVSINADQMNNGIYMYSLVVDGKAILTRKMTITN